MSSHNKVFKWKGHNPNNLTANQQTLRRKKKQEVEIIYKISPYLIRDDVFMKIIFSRWNLFRIHRVNKKLFKSNQRMSVTPHPIWLSPSLTWQVGYGHNALHHTHSSTADGDCAMLCVRLRNAVWHQESFLSFAQMKLVERSLTAAAFHSACHCLHLCLQNTKWAVARNEPLHFLTAASQPSVFLVPSQMFPQHSHVAWHYVLPCSWITKSTILNY